MIPAVRCLLYSNIPKGLTAVSRSTISNQTRNLSVLVAVDWTNGKSRFEVRTGIHEQQIRYRRHDRASAFTKPRPKTKKQRQAYNRKMKRLEDERAKHSMPGAKAGPRRQFIRERWQQLLDHPGQKRELAVLEEDEEYGIEDALIEDIMGNTAHLTSQPTPEPVYLGHRHKHYYNTVADQMDAYREAIDARRAANTDNEKRKNHDLLPLNTARAELPSDESISRVLRAYRDRHGTRNKPIGIALALEHILKDLGVPTMAFGEKTFTTLMTCCRTPKEGRRIIKLMHDRQHPISAYSWSILVDIHSKLGDFEGCVNVIKEMAMEGAPPTQAAYTSLMAACYKVCNDGRIPHAIRAKAGKVGWENWQEMRVVGIEADAMAYGAIIRLCASKGQAERAINLLEEMQRFDVKPTSLCFSSALKAVARSHEIGVRFERGASRKQLRREQFAAHHGNMARQIIIMAETAEVEQDESFVSALMLCAAAAGDSATAKAVFLASEVRKMDHLRTIGSDGHLEQLRGENAQDSLEYLPYSEQELLGQKSDPGELVNITETRNSQIYQKGLPQIHGRERNPLLSFGEREYGKDTRVFSALLRSCGHALNSNGLGTIWAGKQNNGYLCENSLRLITTRWEPSYTPSSIPNSLSSKVGIAALRRYDEDGRDEDSKKGAARKKFRGLYLDDDGVETIDDYASINEEATNEGAVHAFLERRRESDEEESTEGAKVSLTFDSEVAIENQSTDIAHQPQDQNDSIEFTIFFEELKEEAIKNGLEEEPSEEDARELFQMMKEEFGNSSDFESLCEHDKNVSQEEDQNKRHLLESASGTLSMQTSKILGDLEETSSFDDKDISQLSEAGHPATVGLQSSSKKETFLDTSSDDPSDGVELLPTSSGKIEGIMDPVQTEYGDLDDAQLEKIADLREALPGMPVKRLKKVLDAFESTLTLPSMLTLVPILRETLPDHLSSGRLKQINTRTADFAYQKAIEDGVVNGPLLNAMLEVKTGSSALDAAEKFHAEEYGKYKLRPTTFSDRLVFQMFLANNRLQRALTFKQRIENDRRSLDIPSYGSLVDYYARHNQLGSAMLVLKECISKQGAPPSEKYLASIRLLYRQNGLHPEQLHRLIGEDPTEWLRYGERHLKRERSKKGRRNIQLAML